MVLTLWQRNCELGNTEDKESCTELGEEQMCIFRKELVSGPTGQQRQYKSKEGSGYIHHVLCGLKRIMTRPTGRASERLSDLPRVIQLEGGGDKAQTTAVQSH